MKLIQQIFCAAALTLVLHACTRDAKPKAEQPKPKPIPTDQLADYQWLIGSWRMDAGGVFIQEEWTKMNDSTFQGNTYKLVKTDLNNKTPLESVQLQSRNGVVSYVPTVSGQNNNQPVYFKFAGKTNGEYIFENKAHDFPQRVIYMPASATSLKARIEGEIEGKLQKEEFEYAKVNG